MPSQKTGDVLIRHAPSAHRFVRFLMRATPTVTLILGIVLTIGVTYYIQTLNEQREKEQFDFATQTVVGRTTRSLNATVALLYSTRGFIVTNPNASQADFAKFVDQIFIDTNYRGVLGLGFSRRYTSGEISELPDTMKLVPDSPRDEYHVISLSQPRTLRNEQALGFDLATEATRKQALEEARDKGIPVISRRVMIPEETGDREQAGLVVFLPVYSTEEIPSSVEARRENLIGFVFAPLRANEFFLNALNLEPPESVSVKIYAGSKAESSQEIFNWMGNNENQPKFEERRKVEVPGSSLLYDFSSRASISSTANWWFSPLVLAGGMIITLLLYRTTLHQVNARIRAEISEMELSKSKKELEESEQRLKLLVEGAKDYAIIMLNPKGLVVSWNSGAQKMLGYTEDEIVGQSYGILFSYNSKKSNSLRELQQTVKLGNSHYEREFLRRDGTKIWANGVINALYDTAHKLKGFAIIARDVTTRIQTDNALQRSKALNEAILASLPAHIAVLDPSGNILESNKSWKLLMAKVHEQKPQLKSFESNWLDWWRQQITRSDTNIEAILSGVNRVLQGKKKTFTHEFGFSVENKEVWFLLQVTALRHIQGGVVVSLVDISGRKNLEKQKDEFLSIASHELKTPITSTKAYGEVLKRLFLRKNDTQSVKLLEKMDNQLVKVTNLINDLLDISKIEAGKIRFNKELFDFDDMVKEVVDLIQLSTEDHTLEVNLDADVEVYADRERIGQALTNLLTNAIKYSPQADRVVITTKVIDDEVQCLVRDFGIGIEKEKQVQLFQRFYRVSGPQLHTFQGLGLGLYITHEIISRSGGKIWVESLPREGSLFTFSLPTANAKLTKKILS